MFAVECRVPLFHARRLSNLLEYHHSHILLKTSGGSGVYILRASGVAIIAAGGTDLYCHSEPPLTSGKLCFIINFIGEPQGGRIFTGGPWPHPWPPFEPPLLKTRFSRPHFCCRQHRFNFNHCDITGLPNSVK